MTIRVLLADDQHLVRAGFRRSSTPSPTSTWSARPADGARRSTLARRLRPDVVLMDIRMPGWTASRPPGRLTAGPATTRVLVLTTFDLDEYVYDALRAGASGFLLKDAPPEDLVRGDPGRRRRRGAARPGGHPPADRGVLAHPGDPAASAGVRHAHRPGARGAPAAGPRTVQRRDRRRLYVSEATVKTHVARLLTNSACAIACRPWYTPTSGASSARCPTVDAK